MRTAGLVGLLLCALMNIPSQADEPQAAKTGRIAGTAMEVRSGTPDVVVVVCDQKTGVPLLAETKRPFTEAEKGSGLPKLLTALTDERGQFEFTDLPVGEYRLVAQRWTGPFKGVFELHGSVIQLFGTANNIQVPSEEAERLVLTPPGDGVLQFDLEVGNDATLLLLSTQPPAGDPILGFLAIGEDFLQHLIGANRMPYGRTTVVGLPRGTIYAFFFAADNSPGFAAQSFEVGNADRAPRVPFVAGWSDGQHDPPPRIARVMELMQKHNLQAHELLGIERKLSPQEREKAYYALRNRLSQRIELAEGQMATVAEILAAEGYERLQQAVKQRKPADK